MTHEQLIVESKGCEHNACGLDLDQDSVVNFTDFALLDGCCIEVIKE